MGYKCKTSGLTRYDCTKEVWVQIQGIASQPKQERVDKHPYALETARLHFELPTSLGIGDQVSAHGNIYIVDTFVTNAKACKGAARLCRAFLPECLLQSATLKRQRAVQECDEPYKYDQVIAVKVAVQPHEIEREVAREASYMSNQWRIYTSSIREVFTKDWVVDLEDGRRFSVNEIADLGKHCAMPFIVGDEIPCRDSLLESAG